MFTEPNDPPTTVREDGTKEWRDQEGRLHRVGDPAVIFPDGTKMWFQYGMLHRDDGPAMVFPDGSERWWIDGSRVDPPRFDGPVRWDKTARTWVPQD